MSPGRAIGYGAVTVAVLDGLDTIVFFGLRGTSPIRISQGIAAGLLGRQAAIQGGVATGFRLIECRGVPFWRSPRGFTRHENQQDFEVVVIDRQGQRREGLVFFSGPWHGFGPEEVDVRWDET